MDLCFIYTIASHFPENPNYQIVQNYREFFEALPQVIISPKFQRYYVNYLKYHPIEVNLTSRDTLLSWLSRLSPHRDPACDPAIIWKYLLMIVQRYPQRPNFQEVFNYKNFFMTLGNVFPVPKYRQQYIKYLEAVPIDQYLSSNRLFSHWNSKMFKAFHDKNTEFIIENFADFNYSSLAAIMVPVILLGAIYYIK